MRSLSILTLLFVLAASPATAGLETTEAGIQFTYVDPGAGSVALAGDFNAWSTDATPMTDDGSGTWSVIVPLDAGSYEYKFVVNGGTWMADPDNPITGGDYGNSIVEVDADGSLVSGGGAPAPKAQPSGTLVLSNTPANTRVVLGGFFRMMMESTDDQIGDDRLRIDRPQDQFNLDVTANVNESIWGSARVQVRTDNGDFNQVGAELYKAQGNFEADDFSVKAFYNELAYSYDDPFGLFDGGDLRGTIPVEHKPFGQGRQGIVLSMEPFGADLSLMYADTYDEDIFGPENANRDTATDVLSGRLSHTLGAGRVGASYRGQFSDWWINMDAEGNPTPANVQDYLDNRVAAPSEGEDWFELANEEHFFALDTAWPLTEELSFDAAAGYGHYRAAWDVFNKGRIQGSGQANDAVDLPIGDEDYWKGHLGLDYERENWSVGLSHAIRFGDGMAADERGAAYRTQPSSLVEDVDSYVLNSVQQTWVRPNDNDDLNVLLVGPSPDRTTMTTEVSGRYERGDWQFGLHFTRTHDDLAYSNFFPDPTDASVVTPLEVERFAYRTAPTVSFRPFDDERHHVTLHTEFLDYSNPGELQDAGRASIENDASAQTGLGHLMRIESSEFVLEGRVPVQRYLKKPLDLRFDFRFVDYRGEGDAFVLTSTEGAELVRATPADDFFNSFVSLVFAPTNNIEVEVGYGVDPRFYDVINPYGWENGRFRFRENYLRMNGTDPFHPLAQIAAEHILEERSQIVINALVRF